MENISTLLVAGLAYDIGGASFYHRTPQNTTEHHRTPPNTTEH